MVDIQDATNTAPSDPQAEWNRFADILKRTKRIEFATVRASEEQPERVGPVVVGDEDVPALVAAIGKPVSLKANSSPPVFLTFEESHITFVIDPFTQYRAHLHASDALSIFEDERITATLATDKFYFLLQKLADAHKTARPADVMMEEQ